ncbi:hypothetical protein PF008_g17395 [Phytophthora fragariae]|uniref:Uncharacterized protein n=1 Tax=Phytophthora fragariae TaxID=53985 RepID=A0A6G0R8E6_9STRA|nr:hypothetical protein PF008_g17395 [Phytophthora fragariae]
MSPTNTKKSNKSGKSRLKAKAKHFEDDGDESSGETGARQGSGNAGRGKTQLDQPRHDPIDEEEKESTVVVRQEPVSLDPSPATEESQTANSPPGDESASTSEEATERTTEMDAIAATLHQLTTLMATMQPPVSTPRADGRNDEHVAAEVASAGRDGHDETWTAPVGETAEHEQQPPAPATSVGATGPTRRTVLATTGTSTTSTAATTTISDWDAVTAAIHELAGRLEGLQAA